MKSNSPSSPVSAAGRPPKPLPISLLDRAFCSPRRYVLINTLNYLASELHATYGPLFGPGSDEFKTAQKAKLATKFKYVDEQMLGEKPFLMGDHFTIVDACA